MVFLPKFTTVVGNNDGSEGNKAFITAAFDNSDGAYTHGVATVHRGPILGEDPSLVISVQQAAVGSDDWKEIDTLDLSSDEEGDLAFELGSGSFRFKVVLTEAVPGDEVYAVTLWSTGFLERPIC
jgi:hypothetical protein